MSSRETEVLEIHEQFNSQSILSFLRIYVFNVIKHVPITFVVLFLWCLLTNIYALILFVSTHYTTAHEKK
jgi:hypothetical protein